MRARLLLVPVAILALPTLWRPSSPYAAVAYLVGLGLVVGTLWRGASRWQGAARRGWRLLAAAASCWFAGDLLQRVFDLAGHPFASGGPSDVCWLASYPLVALGVVAMLRGRGVPAPQRREIRLDVLALTVAGAVGSWKLMIQPALAGGAPGTQALLAVLYPLGDVAILAAALALLMTPGRRGTATGLVMACFGLTLVLDAAYAVLPLVAPSFDAARLDALLLVVNGLLAAAVVHPTGGELAASATAEDGPNRMPRWRVLMLGVALVVVTVVPGLPGPRAGSLDRAVLLVAASTLSLTILRRVYGVMRERDAAEELLLYRAHHDDLTGLANRALLVERLRRAMRDPAAGLVLCYLDLDGFKAVNDEHGHAGGDQVLRAVGQRLRAIAGPADTVARLGGDEFVMVRCGVAADDVDRVGVELRDLIHRPIELADGHAVTVGVSIGLHRVATSATERSMRQVDVDGALRAADLGMYRAKHGGGGGRVA